MRGPGFTAACCALSGNAGIAGRSSAENSGLQGTGG